MNLPELSIDSTPILEVDDILLKFQLRYRAPELLFGACEYDAGIDIWSIACLFAELWIRRPLFEGSGKFSELDQLGKIFMVMGTPTQGA